MRLHRCCALLLILASTGWVGVPIQAAGLPVTTCPAADPAAIAKAYRAFLSNASASGNTLTIKEGRYSVAGRDMEVRHAASFSIDPADVSVIEDEPLKLGKDKPHAWSTGRPLQGARAGGGINASFAYVPGSLVIRKTPGGDPLIENKDYLVAEEFGMVGIGPEPRIGPDDTVYAGYRCRLMRIDSVLVDRQGRPSLVKGKPDISVPLPPDAPEGTVRLCNVFRPRGAEDLKAEHLFPILESGAMAPTRTTRGRLPRALDKIKSGKPLTVVCLGDSVTAGGDASRPSLRYVDVFESMLKEKYGKNAAINVVNVSYGGTSSRQWLRMEPFNDAWFKTVPSLRAEEIKFERVTALKPDVLTIEFVNDAYMDWKTVEETYSTILRRVKEFGTEVVLITPHFTAMHWMGMKSIRDGDDREYVKSLHRFADEYHLAVADTSSRWAHLWVEGLPYVTLLRNTLNHPDDRGHRLFAEELIRCFEPPASDQARAGASRSEVASAPARDKVRIGVVGLVHGHVYGFLEDVVRRTDVEIVGLAEPREELLRRYGGRHRLPESMWFQDLDRMLDTARPQAVAVFTDTLEHRKVVEACGPRGIHVMMEKPLATGMEHARAIEKAAREGKIHVIVNYETTWYPNTEAAYQLVSKQGQIGSIRKIVVHDGHQGPKEIGMPREFMEWLTDPVRNGGGALFDFGCYGANLATYLLGGQRPLSVTAVTQKLKSDPVYQRVDDEATIVLTYPKAQVIIQASWNWPFSRKDMEIYGEQGQYLTVERDMYRMRTLHAAENLGKAEPIAAPKQDSISYLAAVVRGEVLPSGPSSLKVNMIATEILDAARRSAERGVAIPLADVTPPSGFKPLFDFPVRDTCVCLADGMYYLTGTTGAPTWWKTNEGIRLWKSKDLVAWEPLGLVWSFEKDATWQKPVVDGKRAIWAPELHYIKGTFWLAYCVNHPGGGTGLLKSTSGKAEGPYVDVKPDGPLTKDIDASLFQDDDGSVYFLYQNGRIARMKDDMTGLAGEPRLLKPANADHVGFEGAFLFKVDGRYYLSCAEFIGEQYHCMLASAPTLDGPWSDRHLAVLHGGHNMFFKDAHGRWWSTFFGNSGDAPFRERPGILRVDFTDDRHLRLGGPGSS